MPDQNTVPETEVLKHLMPILKNAASVDFKDICVGDFYDVEFVLPDAELAQPSPLRQRHPLGYPRRCLCVGKTDRKVLIWVLTSQPVQHPHRWLGIEGIPTFAEPIPKIACLTDKPQLFPPVSSMCFTHTFVITPVKPAQFFDCTAESHDELQRKDARIRAYNLKDMWTAHEEYWTGETQKHNSDVHGKNTHSFVKDEHEVETIFEPPTSYGYLKSDIPPRNLDTPPPPPPSQSTFALYMEAGRAEMLERQRQMEEWDEDRDEEHEQDKQAEITMGRTHDVGQNAWENAQDRSVVEEPGLVFSGIFYWPGTLVEVDT